MKRTGTVASVGSVPDSWSGYVIEMSDGETGIITATTGTTITWRPIRWYDRLRWALLDEWQILCAGFAVVFDAQSVKEAK